MKKIRNILVTLLLLFFTITICSYAKADNSSLYLNNLNFNVQINSDGSMDVTEIWDIDIENTNTLYKTFEYNTAKYSGITNGKVSKITSDGREISFKNANQYYYHVPTNMYYFLKRGSEYEIAWGTGHESSEGLEKYKITYHVEDAIGKYEDCSEMYWQFIGSNFEIGANKITGTIKLPKQVEIIEELRVWGHTPDLNGTIYKTNNDTVQFEINDNRPKKMVEIRIAMPTNIIEESGRTYEGKNKLESILQEENQWATEANNARMTKIVIITILCVVIFGVLIFLLIKNLLLIKRTKQVIPTQHYEYFRDLPREDSTPAEALYILENKYYDFNSYEIGAVFSATLLNLSLKKAIKIEEITNEKGKKDTQISIICDNIMNITSKRDEILIFDFVKTACGFKINKESKLDNNSITMTNLKKYIQRYNSKVVSLKASLDKYIKSSLLTRNMLDIQGIKKRNKLLLTGFISTFATFFIFIFVANMNIMTAAMNSIGLHWYIVVAMLALLVIDVIVENRAKNKISVYTQQGIDEQDKWKALKKYMEDFSLLKEKEIPDITIWEKFLVYATAFGISEKVIKQLKLVYPDLDNLDYAVYPHMYMFTHTDFTRNFNSVSTSMSSSFSSGSGGGGGFSGGGGRRRRPEVVVEVDNLHQKYKEEKYVKIKSRF